MNREALEQLRTLIRNSDKCISNDGINAVDHYFQHGEYEMAFEGLVIELMNVKMYPEGFIFSEWEELAIKFGLDANSVFDIEFWSKFKAWGNRC